MISDRGKSIFETKEVDEKSNLHSLQITNSDKPVAYYSLDVIISIGYRVKSQRGIEFIKWMNSQFEKFLERSAVL